MKKNSFKTLILIKLFFLISDALDKISWIVYLRQAFSARQMITCKGQALLIILLLVSDKKLQHWLELDLSKIFLVTEEEVK